MDTKTYKYDVFISYSHGELDNAVAGYLQKALERYRIPKEIRQKTGKQRISRVFRDKEELSVSDDLEHEIKEQIYNSEFLVVICSPNAVASPWVAKEISTFLETHTRKNIIPVLIEGNPQTSFPKALLSGAEHGAADVKGSSIKEILKNTRRELPRIAAPILGCSYAELVQRQRAYKNRRAAVIASAVAFVSLAAGSVTVIQNNKIKDNYRTALINQTRYLDREASIQLDDENTLLAIQLALAALPSKESDRPVTAEAEYALSQAIGAYLAPGAADAVNIWQFKADTTITNMFLSDSCRFLFVQDSAGTVYIWDLQNDYALTFKKHFSAEHLPHILPVGEDLLIEADYKIFRIDSQTGKTKWEMESLGRSLYDAIYDPASDSVITTRYSSHIAFIDASSGSLYREFEIPHLENDPISQYSISKKALSKSGKYLAMDAYDYSDRAIHDVLIYRTDNGTMVSTKLELASIADFHFAKDKLIVTGYADESFLSGAVRIGDTQSVETTTRLIYCININTGEIIWSSPVDFQQVVINSTISDMKLKDFDGNDRDAVVCTFSNLILYYDLNSGELIAKYVTPEPVIGPKKLTSDRSTFYLDNGMVVTIPFIKKDYYVTWERYTDNISHAIAINGDDGLSDLSLIKTQLSNTILLYTDYFYDANYKRFEKTEALHTSAVKALPVEDKLCLLFNSSDTETQLQIMDLTEKKKAFDIHFPDDTYTTYQLLHDRSDNQHVFLLHNYTEDETKKTDLARIHLNTGKVSYLDFETPENEFNYPHDFNVSIAGSILFYEVDPSKHPNVICATYDMIHKQNDYVYFSNTEKEDLFISKWKLNDDATKALIEYAPLSSEEHLYGVYDIANAAFSPVDIDTWPEGMIWDDAGDLAAVFSDDDLSIIDRISGETDTINVSGQTIENGVFYNDRLYLVTKTNRMEIYDFSKKAITDQLDLNFVFSSDLLIEEQWLFKGDDLIISRNHETHWIDLNQMEEKLRVVESLGYYEADDTFTVYADDLDQGYQLGYFHHYSLSELIRIGQDRVKGLSLDDKQKKQYGLATQKKGK